MRGYLIALVGTCLLFGCDGPASRIDISGPGPVQPAPEQPHKIGAGYDCDLSEFDYCEDDRLVIEIQPISPNGNNGSDQASLFTWGVSSGGQAARIGKFANGDYWVAPADGEVTVFINSLEGSGAVSADINPVLESTGLLDGSNGYGNHEPSENIVPQLPVSIGSASSILAAIQRNEDATSTCGTRQIEGECADAYSVLTIMPTVPNDFGKDSLRPAITPSIKQMIPLDDIDWSRWPANDLFTGTDAQGLEQIRQRWSHTINIFALLDGNGEAFSEGGRAFRAHTLVDDYASGMAKQYHDDLVTLFSSANSRSEKQAALAAMLTFGLDLYEALYDSDGAIRYYGSGAGQHLGKFLPMVISAAMFKDTTRADVLRSVSTVINADFQLRPQEIEQINQGINGPVWGDFPDNMQPQDINAYWDSMLKSQCFDGALGECNPNIGKKTSRDPYGYIDGPANLPGSSYMPVTIGPMRAFVATMFLMPEVCDIVNYQPLIDYVDRVDEIGVQTSDDPCAPPDPRESLECDAFRQQNCEFYGLSNTGVATWGPDPDQPGLCITNAEGQNGRFASLHGSQLSYLFTSPQVEANWQALRGIQRFCDPGS